MTEVLLVRHGETDWNRERRFQGHIDIPLNANGRTQAAQLAERLRDARIAAIYSSDLGRAQATAAPVAAQLGLRVVSQPQWRERNYGIFEGLTIPEIEERYPVERARWGSYDPDFVLPGGESQAQTQARAMAALHTVIAAHSGETVLVVTHGGMLDMMYRGVLGMTLAAPRSCPIPNAALNQIRVGADGRLHLVTWADAAHLQDAA